MVGTDAWVQVVSDDQAMSRGSVQSTNRLGTKLLERGEGQRKSEHNSPASETRSGACD